MSINGNENAYLLVGGWVMILGIVLSTIPLWVGSKKAEGLLQRRDLTPWQKHKPTLIALIIASLIAALGFSLASFIFTSIKWGEIFVFESFTACFGCYLSFGLISYFHRVFYYHYVLPHKEKNKRDRVK